MRTNEERIAAMHSRAAELNKQHRAHKVRVLQSAGATIALAATIMLAIFMPRIADFNTVPAEGASDSMNASVFSDSGALGLIVIAIIAFLLGVSTAIFCFRLKEWKDDKDEEEAL